MVVVGVAGRRGGRGDVGACHDAALRVLHALLQRSALRLVAGLQARLRKLQGRRARTRARIDRARLLRCNNERVTIRHAALLGRSGGVGASLLCGATAGNALRIRLGRHRSCAGGNTCLVGRCGRRSRPSARRCDRAGDTYSTRYVRSGTRLTCGLSNKHPGPLDVQCCTSTPSRSARRCAR